MTAPKHTPLPWHAPGLGEVHSADHSQMIYCEIDTGDECLADDELADEVCTAMNSYASLRAANAQLREACEAVLLYASTGSTLLHIDNANQLRAALAQKDEA